MKGLLRISTLMLLSGIVLASITGCQYLKKRVPPSEMFAKAEQFRKSNELIDAAKQYDELLKVHSDSELAPAALYYSGICKYTLSIRCPGKNTFEQQKADLSKTKKDEYQRCIDLMEKQGNSFVYEEALDTYLYNGREFDQLIQQYSVSDLVDDAAFQRVRTRVVEHQQRKTLTVANILQLYADFFEQYPQSPYRKNGVEDMLKLLSEYSGAFADHPTIVETYRKFTPFFDDFPELTKLSYLLGKRLLKEGDPDGAASVLGVPAVVGVGVVVTQQTGLNIRRNQGTQYQIIGKAQRGDELLVLESTGQWYHVQLQDGTVGYAHSDYVKIGQE